MPLDLTDGNSTLVQVMVWCHQATSPYMSQCWPRSISPNGATRSQWVKLHKWWENKQITLSIKVRFFLDFRYFATGEIPEIKKNPWNFPCLSWTPTHQRICMKDGEVVYSVTLGKPATTELSMPHSSLPRRILKKPTKQVDNDVTNYIMANLDIYWWLSTRLQYRHC